MHPPAPIPRDPEPGARIRLDAVLQFMRELWALAHALDSLSKRMALALGVTGPQRLVLMILDRTRALSAPAGRSPASAACCGAWSRR